MNIYVGLSIMPLAIVLAAVLMLLAPQRIVAIMVAYVIVIGVLVALGGCAHI